MFVIALCIIGLIASALVALESIGTRKKLRFSIYASVNVAVLLACAWKMTYVAQTVSEQTASLRESARSQAILERGVARLAQAEGADGAGAPSEVILAVLGKTSERQLREMGAAESREGIRDPDRQKVLQRLTDMYAGQIGDLPRDDQQFTSLPPMPWMNQKLEEFGFPWRISRVIGGHAETIDVAPQDQEKAALAAGNAQSVDIQ